MNLVGRRSRYGESDVLNELDRILGSAEFDASDRNKQFLKYVVLETVAGRDDRIKAYTIATTVFGRPASFDPLLDSIVRIEAGRLRRSLERYYLTSGAEDPIRIVIPKGTYVPSFSPLNDDPTLGQFRTPQEIGKGPSILVMTFEQEGDTSQFPSFGKGFSRHLIVGLTRFTDIFVYGPETSQSIRTVPISDIKHQIDVDFFLHGVISLQTNSFCVEAFLQDSRTGRYLWANSYDRTQTPRNVMALRDEVADDIVRVLAQPYGIIFSKKAREIDERPPDDLDDYECIIRFHQYWRTFDIETHGPVRECLERTISKNPHYAEAFACLSQVFSNEFRYGYAQNEKEEKVSLAKALQLANRAIEMAPNSSHGHFALGLACWFLGDLAGSFEAYETGLNLNPHDTKLMGELGFRYAMQMNWEKAVPLITESYARNPAQSGTYRMGLALFHYKEARFEAALEQARKVDAPGVIYQFVMIAVASSKLGRGAEADEAIAQILDLAPHYRKEIETDLQKRNLHPELITSIVKDIRAAGL